VLLPREEWNLSAGIDIDKADTEAERRRQEEHKSKKNETKKSKDCVK